MTICPKQEKSREPTRDRILRHAIERFSSQSFDTTGLREIATCSGVDVALVHRSFGSKERLFAECVRTSLTLDGVLDQPCTETMDRIFEETVTPREEGELRPIDILVHSFSCTEASRVLREVAAELVIDPLVKVSNHGSDLRVALSLSILFGFAIMRDVIGIEALKQADLDEVRRLLGKARDALEQE
ncbi:AcrR family transcriptional regulator [Agrobacterium vitis]|nr:AcrR family transcriptional regulator [Agrobacterium vitis]MBE1436396.1 AcrR family transcriptional regulator [Agrobacterium vitis]